MSNGLKWAVLATALIAMPAMPAFAAMTADQCTELFKKSDTNTDGSLGGEEGVKFEEAMTKTDVKVKDAGIVTQEEFMKSCEAGTFDGMQM